MITLKRLNGMEFVLNSDLIEQIESTPDTVITLVSGNNIIVRESRSEVVEKIIEFRQKISVERSEQAKELTRQR